MAEREAGIPPLRHNCCGIDDFDRHLSRQQAIETALRQPREALSMEKRAVEFAIEDSLANIKVEGFCAQSEQHRALFENAYSEFSSLIQPNGSAGSKLIMEVLPFVSPPPHPDGNLHAAIKNEFSELSAERDRYFPMLAAGFVQTFALNLALNKQWLN